MGINKGKNCRKHTKNTKFSSKLLVFCKRFARITSESLTSIFKMSGFERISEFSALHLSISYFTVGKDISVNLFDSILHKQTKSENFVNKNYHGRNKRLFLTKLTPHDFFLNILKKYCTAFCIWCKKACPNFPPPKKSVNSPIAMPYNASRANRPEQMVPSQIFAYFILEG